MWRELFSVSDAQWVDAVRWVVSRAAIAASGHRAPCAGGHERCGSGSDTAHNLYWGQGNYVWNNTGGKATLRKASAKKVGVCKFSGAGSFMTCSRATSP